MKIVFTGGVCAGKTTIITELKKRGYQIVPEAGIIMTQRLIKKLGSEGFKEKFRKSFKEISHEWFKVQKELDSKTKKSEIIFFDRHYPDIYGFSKHFKGEISSKLKKEIKKHKYDYVFIFDTISKFDPRKKSGRITDTKEKADKQKKRMKEVYKSLGHKIISVPEMSIKKRTEFILKKIKIKN